MKENLENDIPFFEEVLPEKIIFDLDTEGPFTYISPKAIDKDNHTINMNFVNMTEYSFIKIRALLNDSFILVIDDLLVTDNDLGEHILEI